MPKEQKKDYYLLTEWEGRMEKYLARVERQVN